TWKVTLTVKGTSTGRARLFTCTPLDLERQHLVDDAYSSDEMTNRPPEARHPERRRVLWAQRHGTPAGAIRVRSEFHVQVGRPAAGFARSSSPLYAAPEAAEYLSSDGLIEAGHERISARARALTAAAGTPGNTLDTAQALFRFVEQKIGNEVRF